MVQSCCQEKSIKQLQEAFLQIEDDLDLFDLRVNGVYIWQYLRFRVFSKIVESLAIYGQAHTKMDTDIGGLTSMAWLALKHSLARNALIGKSKDVLVICHARRKLMEDKRYWDIYTDLLLPQLKGLNLDAQAIEGFHEGAHLMPAKTAGLKYFDFVFALAYARSKFLKVSLTEPERSALADVGRRIKAETGAGVDVTGMALEKLRIRNGFRPVLKRMLKSYRPKLVLELCYYNTVNMVLNELCKELGITTVELQHGTICPCHMAYDFPKLKRQLEVFPEYFLSFGKYWEDCTNLPLPKNHIFTCGYPYLETEYKKYKKTKNNKQVLFISQGTIGKELSKIAVEFAEKGDYDVVYKLHPGEYSRWKEEYPWLLESKVKVIDNDNEPFYKLLAESYAQVGVYSTAIYEGLVFGLRTFIAELPGWENMADLIDGGYAVKVVDAAGLSRSLKSGKGKKLNVDYFFKKDSLSRQKRCIHDILEKKIINS
jgi:hypothetical protein